MILVAGGTGFVGRSIVRRLVQDGAEVRCASRNPDTASSLFENRDRLEYVRLDVREPRTFDEAVRGAKTVINCVQFPNHPVENPGKGFTYLEIDCHGTTELVGAAKRAGAEHFIYLSGAGVRPDANRVWFQAKWKAETAIRESGIPFTIIRPSWVYGRDDKSLNKIWEMGRLLPFLPVIGDGDARIQPVFVEDVAELVARSAREEKAKGKVFEIGGPDLYTMNGILLTMLGVRKRRRFLLHHPMWFMKTVAWFLQWMPGPPLNPAAIDFITQDGLVNLAELRNSFPDFRLTPLPEGLAKY